MNQRRRSFISFVVALALVMGSIALAGCTGSGSEQDNCYGEDMPVINE